MNKLRIIEIEKYGKFYVTGQPKFVVIEAPNADIDRAGYIIIQENFHKFDPTKIDVQILNCVYKLGDDGSIIARLLVKNRETAEEICYACNRLRV